MSIKQQFPLCKVGKVAGLQPLTVQVYFPGRLFSSVIVPRDPVPINYRFATVIYCSEGIFTNDLRQGTRRQNLLAASNRWIYRVYNWRPGTKLYWAILYAINILDFTSIVTSVDKWWRKRSRVRNSYSDMQAEPQAMRRTGSVWPAVCVFRQVCFYFCVLWALSIDKIIIALSY